MNAVNDAADSSTKGKDIVLIVPGVIKRILLWDKPAIVKPAALQLSYCGSCSSDASTTTEQKSGSRFSFNFISSKQRLVISGVLAVAAEALDWFEMPTLFPVILALLAGNLAN